MTKRIIIKFLPAIIIAIVAFSFHIRLFYPESSIYITPDYGRSDSWHFSIANKFFYAQELKQNRIPLWNPYIGSGFPTLAEGQTAVFYIPNLIFFRFLPFVFAYNFTLVLSFAMAGWGMYLFARSIGLKKHSSLFAGIAFPLSGFFVFHVQHHHLLQTASLTPWLFWLINEFLKTNKIKFLLLFSFVLSQQIFTGFPQLVLYTLTGIVIYLCCTHIFMYKLKAKVLLGIILATTFGTCISAAQLLPTYELLQESTKTTNPQAILEQFPYRYSNLLQFLDPFILGSPKSGTYPQWIPGVWGIFWESVGYVGKIPLIFAVALSIAIFVKKIRDRKILISLLILTCISLLFTLGEYSPLRILYSFPPYSLFRVPSRFLLLTQTGIILMAGFYLNKINNRKIISGLIFLLIVELFFSLYSYNLTGNANSWFKKPEILKIIGTESLKIETFSQPQSWNSYFSKGWNKNDTSEYFYFSRNALDHNANVIFNVDQYNAYESIQTKRTAAKNSLILTQNLDDKLFVSQLTYKILRLSSITNIISTKKIDSHNIEELTSVSRNSDKFFLYNLNQTADKYRVVDDIKTAIGKNQITSTISSATFDPQKSILLEKTIPMDNNSTVLEYDIKNVYQSPTKLIFKVNTNKTSLFLIDQSFYPGWKAKVNNNIAEILPANINSMAVALSAGSNDVELYFKPTLYTSSFSITVALYLLLFIASFKFYKAKFN